MLSSFGRIDSSRPKTYSAFCWVAELAKPSRLKISPIVIDSRRGSPRDSRIDIARGKSLSAIRTSQPFLSADRFLLALIPEPSNAAITWLACCSSRWLYNAEPLQPTSARQASSRAMNTRRLFAFDAFRSEEHTSELQSLMRISYAVFCLKKKTRT